MVLRKNSAFTLIEILLGLAISAVVMTGIYQVWHAQQRSYFVQQEVANMQQNLRAALFMLTGEIRMAGYDPTGKAAAGIVSAVPAAGTPPADDALLRFTRDLNADGDTGDSNEDVTYSLYTDSKGIRKLGRKNPKLNRPIVSHIDALDFVFLDRNGNPTANPAEIRSVLITLVARTAAADKDYRNDSVYRNRMGKVIFGPAGDGFRRGMRSIQIRCRNLM